MVFVYEVELLSPEPTFWLSLALPSACPLLPGLLVNTPLFFSRVMLDTVFRYILQILLDSLFMPMMPFGFADGWRVSFDDLAADHAGSSVNRGSAAKGFNLHNITIHV